VSGSGLDVLQILQQARVLLAFKQGYSKWLEADPDTAGGLAPYTATALEDLRAATASLS
jgi:hypothetical protein